MPIKLLENRCSICKSLSVIKVDQKAWEAWWFHRKPITEAMPELTFGQRLILVQGYCMNCYNKLYPEEV